MGMLYYDVERICRLWKHTIDRVSQDEWRLLYFDRISTMYVMRGERLQLDTSGAQSNSSRRMPTCDVYVEWTSCDDHDTVEREDFDF